MNESNECNEADCDYPKCTCWEGKKNLQSMVDKLAEDAYLKGTGAVKIVLAEEYAELKAENQRLTNLLDEGQSLAGDACSEPFTYAMSRLLGDWVNKVNAELYRQAGASDA